jgi:YidC/Oxa1 family membrane protein insertase
MFRDRTTLIVVSLATVGLVASLIWQQQESTKARAEYDRQLALRAAQATPATQESPTPAPAPSPNANPIAATPGVPEKVVTLASDVAEFRFSNTSGGLAGISLLTHKAEENKPVELNNELSPGIGAITQSPNDWRDSGYNLEANSATGTATLSRETADHLSITKTFTLAQQAGLKEKFQTRLSITFKNNGPSDFTSPGYFVSTGAAQPIHQTDLAFRTVFDWYRDGKFNSINVGWFDPHSILFFPTGPAQETYSNSADSILWAAVGSQYFTTILAPATDTGRQVWARRIFLGSELGNQRGPAAIQGAIGMPGFTLKPGESKTTDFLIYAGPKELDRLSRLPNNQVAVMNFGWWTPICNLLLSAMNTIHAVVGSYALAIILLTIFIRLLIWPLQNASMKSMRKMSKLSPIMNELRTKYKDDPQRMNQETMKLYKEYGVNPVGGCLPMFVQIPIFISFYTMLGSAIELRNSSFLWVRDLSQPDTVAHILGFPINILPIVMAGAQIWQMQITPKTGDPAQQRMLYIMPVIFLIFCYNYASGLALYWTVSTLFTVAQTYLTRNQTEPKLVKVSQRTAVAKRKSYR